MPIGPPDELIVDVDANICIFANLDPGEALAEQTQSGERHKGPGGGAEKLAEQVALDVGGFDEVQATWNLHERSAGGAWTKATVSTVESRLNPIVVSRSGRATVLMASAARLYARTQVS